MAGAVTASLVAWALSLVSWRLKAAIQAIASKMEMFFFIIDLTQ